MEINTYLSTTESKKQTKQTIRTEKGHGCREHLDDYQIVGWCGGMGKKVRGLRRTNR